RRPTREGHTAMTEVDLGAAWTEFWTTLGFNQFDGILMAAGIGVFAIALIIYLVKRSRDQGGAKFPWAATLVAVALAGPAVIFPFFADIVSALINVFITIANKGLGMF